MTLSIVDFLNARLKDDQDAAESAGADVWTFDDDDYWRIKDAEGHFVVYDEGAPGDDQAVHIARHDPARVLREVAAKRRIMARHCRYDGSEHSDYCAGCPSGDETGYPDTELKECPELQDMAFVWNEHEDWNTEWCPHVEGRHEADVTEVPPARGCYTNACNRCGSGDGWHYRDRSTT